MFARHTNESDDDGKMTSKYQQTKCKEDKDNLESFSMHDALSSYLMILWTL